MALAAARVVLMYVDWYVTKIGARERSYYSGPDISLELRISTFLIKKCLPAYCGKAEMAQKNIFK